ncbi:MAG: hypothetical protein Q4P11_00150 [Methanobrevibacter sp.]|nr:hypothetical protein [Methanobrevibacter sp.]
MAIKIDPTDNSYHMAEMRIDSERIYSNELTMDFGEDGGDPKTVTNSADPIRYGRTTNSYEWGASGIEPEFFDFLMEAKLKKKLFPVGVFRFGPDGDYKSVGTMINAKISEVNWSYGDDGVTVDVSGSALGFELPR